MTDLNWPAIADAFDGRRSVKQCRERWNNHLDPSLLKTKWTDQDDRRLRELQSELGNTWTRIAANMPGRSENEVKNRWYSWLQKHRKSSQTSPRPIHQMTTTKRPRSDSLTAEGSGFKMDQDELPSDEGFVAMTFQHCLTQDAITDLLQSKIYLFLISALITQ